MSRKYPAVLHGEEKDAYETGVVGVYNVGQKLITPSGNVFRYGSLGTTTNAANKLYQSSAPVGNWESTVLTVAMTVGATWVDFEDGGTAFTKNEAAQGTILAQETDNFGHIYLVKENDVTVGSVTRMYLEDGVKVIVALASGGDQVMTFVPNPWWEIIISPAGINSAANAGVSRVAITDAYWGWIQTRGVASCLIDAGTDVVTYGTQLRGSEDDVGAVALREESVGIMDYQKVGYALETAPDGDFGHIFLQIE